MTDGVGNETPVEEPHWSGAKGELAIMVGRGLPNRTNLQMQRAIYVQAGRYLERWTDVQLDALDLALAVQWITEANTVGDQIRAVHLRREDLLDYFRRAMNATDDLRAARRQDEVPIGGALGLWAAMKHFAPERIAAVRQVFPALADVLDKAVNDIDFGLGEEGDDAQS